MDVVARAGPSCSVTCNLPHYPLRAPPISLAVPVALGAEAGVAIHLIQAAGVILAPVVLAVIEVLTAVAPHVARRTFTPGAGERLTAASSLPTSPSWCHPPRDPCQPITCRGPELIFPTTQLGESSVGRGSHLGPWLVEMQVEPCRHGLSSAEQKSGGCSQKSPAGQMRGCQGVPISSGTGGTALAPTGLGKPPGLSSRQGAVEPAAHTAMGAGLCWRQLLPQTGSEDTPGDGDSARCTQTSGGWSQRLW